MEELEKGEYVDDVDEMMSMDKDTIFDIYKKRKIEAKGELDEEVDA